MKILALLIVVVCNSLTYADTKKTETEIVESLKAVTLANLTKMIEAKPITGDEWRVRSLVEGRLRELDLKFEYIESLEKRPNYVIRLKATEKGSKKALLLLAHLDVVTAEGQKWTKDPHIVSKDEAGFIYGRGVLDDLIYASAAMEILGQFKKSEVKLERDIILILSSDEEKGGFKGMDWLVKNRPELFQEVDFALNEGGAVITDKYQKPLFIGLAAAEKIYQDFRIEASGPTGHSSVPPQNNAIYALSEAVMKIKNLKLTPHLSDLTRSYFKARGQVETDPEIRRISQKLGQASDKDMKDLSKNYAQVVKTIQEKYPVLHALIRTSCVATVFNGGTIIAKNALPPVAHANVNCRLLPDEDLDDFSEKLSRLVSQKNKEVVVSLTREDSMIHGPASPMNHPVVEEVSKLAKTYFHGIPLIPSLMTGATDSRFLRRLGIPAYGIGPVIISDEDRRRSHGIDERLYLANIGPGLGYFRQLLLNLSATEEFRSPASEKLSYPGKPSTDFTGPLDQPHENCQH